MMLVLTPPDDKRGNVSDALYSYDERPAPVE